MNHINSFIMFDCYAKCYSEFVDEYLGFLKKFVHEDGVHDTDKSEYPICPWCGGAYKIYEDFLLPDFQILCCREETDNEFTIVRHKETEVFYSTHRIDKSKYRRKK